MNDSLSFPSTLFYKNNKKHELVSDDTTLLILKIFLYGLTPSISAVGICGNILSILILTRHGMDKSSNILLVTLAFSDVCFLVAVNNVPLILYDIQGKGSFTYSYTVSHGLFILSQLLLVIDYGMCSVGLNIPALITIERLIAVFFPLQMPRIVTPARTWSVVVFFIAYGIGYMTYTRFWFHFDYSFQPSFNKTVGWIVTTSLYFDHASFRKVMDEIVLSERIQPAITLVGCLLIIIKVKMASLKRKKMAATSKHPSVSKTTQTLLAVCIMYLVVCAVATLPSYLPKDIVHYSISSDTQSNLGAILYQVMNIAVATNGSWNFLIYMRCNKRFRQSFREILGNCCHRGSAE